MGKKLFRWIKVHVLVVEEKHHNDDGSANKQRRIRLNQSQWNMDRICHVHLIQWLGNLVCHWMIAGREKTIYQILLVEYTGTNLSGIV